MSRATALLHPGGRRAKYAKAKPSPKSTKAAGPAEMHKKAVREFVEATKTLKDSSMGESVFKVC